MYIDLKLHAISETPAERNIRGPNQHFAPLELATRSVQRSYRHFAALRLGSHVRTFGVGSRNLHCFPMNSFGDRARRVKRAFRIAPLNQNTRFIRTPIDVLPLESGSMVSGPESSSLPST